MVLGKYFLEGQKKGKKNKWKRKHIKQSVQSSKINICRKIIRNALKIVISDLLTIAKKFNDEMDE